MVRIADLLAAGPTLSFEFFPPKTDEGVRALETTLDELAVLAPSFVSVTYGAGGSTKERTRSIVLGINERRSFPAMPHLTCMSHTKAEVVSLLDDYAAHGIDNILALAGDPPADGTASTGEFTYALELVELVRDNGGDFSIGVAAFPETHPRSTDRETDRRHLAAKLEAADFGITQFFYDVDDYVRMIDELDALGVRKPVLPGVLPPTNPASVRRFAAINGSRVPEELLTRIEAASPPDQLAIAVESASALCGSLVEAGAPGIHLYTLNRADAVTLICANLSAT
jgi:methylenetetrahydrofolate reductase (NADPH)